MLAHDGIVAGSASIAVAGGMESMSNAPYLLSKARQGYRMGHGEVFDHMFLDGLEDAYDKGRLMGTFAEDCAEAFQFTREAQDDYALASLERALAAGEHTLLMHAVAPIVVARSNRTARPTMSLPTPVDSTVITAAPLESRALGPLIEALDALQGVVSSGHGEVFRDQVVSREAVLDLLNVAPSSDAGHIFKEHNPHGKVTSQEFGLLFVRENI